MSLFQFQFNFSECGSIKSLSQENGIIWDNFFYFEENFALSLGVILAFF